MTPENPLEEALVAAATEVDARPTFYRLMLESPLFIIDESEQAPRPAESHTLQAGAQLRIATLEIGGVPHTPIFSSISRLREVLDAQKTYVAINGRQLLEIVQGSHLVLNPGSPYGKVFIPEETKALLSGAIFNNHTTRVLDKPTQVMLGQPAVHPSHITDALAERFSEVPAVKAAYLALCMFPDSNEPAHTLIGVDAEGEWEPVIDATMATLRDVAPPSEPIDIVRIDDSGTWSYLVNETKPFYTRRKRKRFGLF